jgi:hypothetical protein
MNLLETRVLPIRWAESKNAIAGYASAAIHTRLGYKTNEALAEMIKGMNHNQHPTFIQEFKLPIESGNLQNLREGEAMATVLFPTLFKPVIQALEGYMQTNKSSGITVDRLNDLSLLNNEMLSISLKVKIRSIIKGHKIMAIADPAVRFAAKY